MPVELGKAFFSLEADDSKLDATLKSAETKVTQSTQAISGKMVAMSAAIGAAIGSIAGGYIQRLLGELDKVQSFFTEASPKTAEWGEQMEHLGARMGMTAQQAAILTGVMERHGISGNIAARSMQVLAIQLNQTSRAIDPFNTKLGQVLGSLRNASGAMMNTGEVMDAARQKILGTADATQQLEIAQQVFGARIGGQLLPMLRLSNTEWENQKKAVADSLGDVNAAAAAAVKYKEASVALEQSIHGVQIELGTAMLPILTAVTEATTRATASWKKFFESFDTSKTGWQNLKALGGGTEEEQFRQNLSSEMSKLDAKDKENSDRKTEGNNAYNESLLDTEKLEQQKVSTASKNLELTEKAASIGQGGRHEVEIAAQQELIALQKQRLQLQRDLSDPNITQDTRDALNEKLLQNQLAGVEAVAKATQKMYTEQEMQAKALGLVNSTSEIAFLEQQLNDAHIAGDARLKIEADLFQKRQQYEEEAMKLSRELGFKGVQDELQFRQQKTADLLKRGDIAGAGGEMKKIRDLQLQEGDSAMEFEKKIQVVAISDEIDFQKQKLEIVKGNAQEERKVLESIADLDKQLYDKRLSFATNYTQGVQGQYDAIMKAAQSTGDVQSFEQAKVESDRQLLETARQASGVTQGGGTGEQREAALKFVDFVDKQETAMKQTGQEQSDAFREVLSITQDIKRAAGLETRDVTGPSAAVGSLTSPSEGLSTSDLARGSEIPRLDTSFTDLAVRVRDVFLGTIPNISSFSDAIKQATAKLTGQFGNPINAPPGGGLGPGGGQQNLTPPLTTASSSSPNPAPNTGYLGGSTPIGLTASGNFESVARDLSDNTKLQSDTIQSLIDGLSSFKTVTDGLAAAIASLKEAQSVDVNILFDPNSQDTFKAAVVKTFAENIQQQ